MAWRVATHPRHTGLIVGFVPDPAASHGVRHLSDEDGPGPRSDLTHIAAGCTCGWTSPAWPVKEATWHNYSVTVNDELRDDAISLWKIHIEEVLNTEPPSALASPARADN